MARLEIANLSVDFGGIHALRDVSFSVDTGTIFGLIGPNGAGKSTLLNCISGFTRSSTGLVSLDGVRLSALPTATIAGHGIGRVFQHPELVAELTVRENLLIACHRALDYGLLSELFMLPRARRQERQAEASVAAVLERLGLRDSAGRLVLSLPYGHRKLVELGRALLMRVKFLLLDEPVAGLNDAEIARLGDLVLELRDELGLGVVLVEHNMAFVSRLCDRLVVLDAGAVLAAGAPAAVLSDPKVMASYLGEAMDA
ncbi:MAG: ABC transporter ATP-binding protein [Alphaproteobacteria bacterium]